jgi:hypothetical protein
LHKRVIGQEEDALARRGFTRVDVGDNSDIAYILEVHTT